jgi:hypothetical protein
MINPLPEMNLYGVDKAASIGARLRPDFIEAMESWRSHRGAHLQQTKNARQSRLAGRSKVNDF